MVIWLPILKTPSLVQHRDERAPFFQPRLRLVAYPPARGPTGRESGLGERSWFSRRSHEGGYLPWRTIELVRGSANREFGKMTLRRFSFGSAAEVLDGSAED